MRHDPPLQNYFTDRFSLADLFFSVSRLSRAAKPQEARNKFFVMTRHFIWSCTNQFPLWSYTILVTLYMYVAKTQGQMIWWGQRQAANEAFTTLAICCKFQKKCWEFCFYTDFFMLYTCRARGRWLQFGKFRASQDVIITWSFALSFRRTALNSDFTHIFSCFYTCIHSQDKGRLPQTTTFLSSYRSLLLQSFLWSHYDIPNSNETKHPNLFCILTSAI